MIGSLNHMALRLHVFLLVEKNKSFWALEPVSTFPNEDKRSKHFYTNAVRLDPIMDHPLSLTPILP